MDTSELTGVFRANASDALDQAVQTGPLSQAVRLLLERIPVFERHQVDDAPLLALLPVLTSSSLLREHLTLSELREWLTGGWRATESTFACLAAVLSEPLTEHALVRADQAPGQAMLSGFERRGVSGTLRLWQVPVTFESSSRQWPTLSLDERLTAEGLRGWELLVVERIGMPPGLALRALLREPRGRLRA